MCNPAAASIIAVVASLASTAVQSSVASRQQSFQDALAKRNSDLANQSARTQYKALNDQAIQEAVKAGQAVTDIAKESELARSRVEVAAIGAGVTGSSVDALLRDFERQEGEFIAATLLNEDFAQNRIELEKQSVNTGLAGRLLSAIPNQVQRPNLFGAAASAFSSATNAYLSATAAQDDGGEG